MLAEWDYKNYRYQIIDMNNKLLRNYLHISQDNTIYDFLNNTAEFNDDGIEHYERLLFYKVEYFEGALEKLDAGIRENQKL